MNPIVETDFEDETKRIHITVYPEEVGEKVHFSLVIDSNGFILDVWPRSSQDITFSTYEFWQNIKPEEKGEEQ